MFFGKICLGLSCTYMFYKIKSIWLNNNNKISRQFTLETIDENIKFGKKKLQESNSIQLFKYHVTGIPCVNVCVYTS